MSSKSWRAVDDETAWAEFVSLRNDPAFRFETLRRSPGVYQKQPVVFAFGVGWKRSTYASTISPFLGRVSC